ncbi:diguanylate cyclase [Geomonas silvestris]|uniref:Diguanylate cyclase n=1 Tax=Geomonas silvestris TaxID=2740184 RepID=A0A6V8MP78_9BACT|nr:GGDEF domain-containing protein [Geomonas silvestris]GFO61865.1 diguanylate cyclase [Geomonas silvestris]
MKTPPTPSPELILESLFDGVYCVDRDRGIYLWNKSAERITGFSKAEVLGKCCSANILQHLDDEGENLCLNACPLSATMRDGQERVSNIYLHHKQGHRVPVSVRTTPIRDEQGAVIGAIEVFADNSQSLHVLRELEALKKEACLDALTGVGNRRYGQITLKTRIYEWQTDRVPFGVIFFDIDTFKDVNDNFGHAIGDEVLAMVAKTVSNLLRRLDVISRWGGDEFVAILNNVRQRDFQIITERIRTFVANSFIMIGDHKLSVTASIGATLAKPGDTSETILQRADALMYASKSDGRNRVTLG